MRTLIDKAIAASPCVGIPGVMYPYMFCNSVEEWNNIIRDAKHRGDKLYDEVYLGTGNVGEIGEVKIVTRQNFSFAYFVNAYGDWVAMAFTLEKIAKNERMLKCAGVVYEN